jgi:hypothetical protein
MVDWSEVERVKRDGEQVTVEDNGHKWVKIYRLTNGSRRRDSSSLNLGTSDSIPKEEQDYKTSWKCDTCGTEVGSSPSSRTTTDCN